MSYYKLVGEGKFEKYGRNFPASDFKHITTLYELLKLKNIIRYIQYIINYSNNIDFWLL